MTANDRCDLHRLLVRAHDLFSDALWAHIYDASCGDRPDAHCEYSLWLRDAEAFLIPEEACDES